MQRVNVEDDIWDGETRRAAVLHTAISQCRRPAPYSYWINKRHLPRCVLAPMVDQSELAWRLLARANGADLCWTPMLHAQLFATDSSYRRDNFVTCSEDRPLIVQFCANNIQSFVTSCLMVADFCDGVDLNLGCPQAIARKGRYGAFIQDDWQLIHNLVSSACHYSEIPISCKIRVFDDVDKTVHYAKMLETAGCQMLTVHGRTREMKGPLTSVADWAQIKAVKDAVNIPVIANGNIQYFSDIIRCTKETGVDAVMSAEGHLSNPFIFTDGQVATWLAAKAYLDFVDQYPCPLSFTRAHLFKLFHHSLCIFYDLREELSRADSTDHFRHIASELQFRCESLHGQFLNDPNSIETNQLPFPHWICQPYVRPSVGKVKEENEWRREQREHLERTCAETGMSKRFIRKMERRGLSVSSRKSRKRKTDYETCSCGHVLSNNCNFLLCRNCCKDVSASQRRSCLVHRFKFDVKRPQWMLTCANNST